MEDALVPSKTRVFSTKEDDIIRTHHGDTTIVAGNVSLQSPGDVLKVLQSEPDNEQLTRALQWLNSEPAGQTLFNIKIPGPQASEIINVLINDIVPAYWPTLAQSQTHIQVRQKKLLIRSLGSIAGLAAILANLRSIVALLQAKAESKKVIGDQNGVQLVWNLINLLECIVGKDKFVLDIWNDITSYIKKESSKSLLWREFISLISSGKLLSTVAEASRVLDEKSSTVGEATWIGDGTQYAAWVGRNIGTLILQVEDDREKENAVQLLLHKSLTLGFTDQIVDANFLSLIRGDETHLEKYRRVLGRSSNHEQRSIIYSLLRIISKYHKLNDGFPNSDKQLHERDRIVCGAAALVARLARDSSNIGDALVDWVVGTFGDGASFGVGIRRAVVAALSSNQEQTKNALQQVLQLFGDKLYIRHTPILIQEVNAQSLLLLVGSVYRIDSSYLSSVTRSSVYLNAISNRLAASSPKSRFLGMIVATAVSELVDPQGKRIVFSSDEMAEAGSQSYKSLIKIHDHVGLISDLKGTTTTSDQTLTRRNDEKKTAFSNADTNLKQVSTSKIISIEEVNDESESEDENLPVYEKPDSDPEDEDEDPTLVQRNKPTAPVYIRDLMSGLRDTENYDKHKLALSTAPTLIRRKAGFGTEVHDHIEEMATILVGLGDKYKLENFQKLRVQAMIAVLVSEPLLMGQWFSRTYFAGDFSMSQRASILTTLGLGARELAGLKSEDAALTGTDAMPENLFPSKRLPAKMQRFYDPDTLPVTELAQRIERTIIAPRALSAADKMTGPNALKVRTFSSRMEVEKTRQKTIPNALAKIIGDGFVFPLIGLYRLYVQTHGNKGSHSSPFLLVHYLRTLSLLIHASGPSTLSLPAMTSELWDLLLSLRQNASNDVTVLEALLFALLTMLDVNEDKRRIVDEHGKELLETQKWVEGVFDGLDGRGDESERVKMLAAGVLVATREVVEKYERVLLGDLAGFM